MESDQTPSESLVTSEDELGAVAAEQGCPAGERQRREEGKGESSHSTPPRPQQEVVFAASNVGDTVIQLDKVCAIVCLYKQRLS